MICYIPICSIWQQNETTSVQGSCAIHMTKQTFGHLSHMFCYNLTLYVVIVAYRYAANPLASTNQFRLCVGGLVPALCWQYHMVLGWIFQWCFGSSHYIYIYILCSFMVILLTSFVLDYLIILVMLLLKLILHKSN